MKEWVTSRFCRKSLEVIERHSRRHAQSATPGARRQSRRRYLARVQERGSERRESEQELHPDSHTWRRTPSAERLASLPLSPMLTRVARRSEGGKERRVAAAAAAADSRRSLAAAAAPDADAACEAEYSRATCVLCLVSCTTSSTFDRQRRRERGLNSSHAQSRH